jgi:diaminohydroxyphosphoribosylaminopyrimidine deaminase/5-amino-6-(5-phosphoribosylamino)uracil reductase
VTDADHMRHALMLAGRGIGRTAPNPSVGCIIVSTDGHVIGRGRSGDGGRPHAETIALAQAGDGARGASAYVTLEPCAHHGHTPPCAEALVKAGVARVVTALRDPDERVAGKGLAILRSAGIEVVTGVLKEQAAAIHAGYLRRVIGRRPLVTLKIAQSLDGKTASASGASKWITGGEARRFAQLLRARHDAILVGIDTVLADDPELTCRLPGLEHYSPLRVVLDTRLRLPESAKLVQGTRSVPTLVFTAQDGSAGLEAHDVQVVKVGCDARGRVDIVAVLEVLGARGVNRLLVEGGAGVHAAFLDGALADRLEIFTAPMLLGAAGHGAIAALAARSLDEAASFVRLSSRQLGADRLESFAVKA